MPGGVSTPFVSYGTQNSCNMTCYATHLLYMRQLRISGGSWPDLVTRGTKFLKEFYLSNTTLETSWLQQQSTTIIIVTATGTSRVSNCCAFCTKISGMLPKNSTISRNYEVKVRHYGCNRVTLCSLTANGRNKGVSRFSLC